jgi:hypothetical protein
MSSTEMKEWVYKLRGEIAATIGLINFAVVLLMLLSQMGVFGFGGRISACELKTADIVRRVEGLEQQLGNLNRELRENIQANDRLHSTINQELTKLTSRLDQATWTFSNKPH